MNEAHARALNEGVIVVAVSLFDACGALGAAGARTFRAALRRRFWLSDFGAEIEFEIPVRVFFSEKHMVALVLPSEARFSAGELIIGSNQITPREFRERVEEHIGRFRIFSTSFKAPIILPLDCDLRIRGAIGGRTVLSWSSRFDAGEVYIMNTARRIILHEYWNDRTGMCDKHLILYNALHSASDIAKAMYRVLWVTRNFLPEDVEKAVENALARAPKS